MEEAMSVADDKGYMIRMRCKNCGHSGTFFIPKGISWQEYGQHNACPVCGCQKQLVRAA